eukprot:5080268-Heterocapsa_arctica.AAC.1
MSEVRGGITAPSAPKYGMQKVSSALDPDGSTCQGPGGLPGGVQEYRLETAAITARGSDKLQFSSPHAPVTHVWIPQPRNMLRVGGTAGQPGPERFRQLPQFNFISNTSLSYCSTGRLNYGGGPHT